MYRSSLRFYCVFFGESLKIAKPPRELLPFLTKILRISSEETRQRKIRAHENSEVVPNIINEASKNSILLNFIRQDKAWDPFWWWTILQRIGMKRRQKARQENTWPRCNSRGKNSSSGTQSWKSKNEAREKDRFLKSILYLYSIRVSPNNMFHVTS